MAKKSIVLYLHVHQPWRVRDDQAIFNVGENKDYFSEEKGLKRQSNGEIFRKVAEKSYIPMNNLLEKLLARHPEFKFSFSITGTFIDQAQQFAPDVLESFKRLVRTGRVEIVAETYYHSLAFFLIARNSKYKFVRIKQRFVKFSVLKLHLFGIRNFLIMMIWVNGRMILALKQFWLKVGILHWDGAHQILCINQKILKIFAFF